MPKTDYTKSRSLSHQAWQRLKKNKLAMFGLSIIGISIFIAIAGPLIQPDSTPMANEMALELTTKRPGFSVKMLLVKKNQEAKYTNIFKKLVFGEESEYKAIPIYDYWFEGDYIVVESYTGLEINNGIESKHNLADVVFSINYNNLFKTTSDGSLVFYDFEGNKIRR